MQDIKNMVQYCLEADKKFLKAFGKNFSLKPMGSTTAGFTKGGKDFFTTFGSYQVESEKGLAVISLVATHEGLQTLELHLDEDDTRDIAIIQQPKPKPKADENSGETQDNFQDEISSQATPATALDTTCDEDDPFGDSQPALMGRSLNLGREDRNHQHQQAADDADDADDSDSDDISIQDAKSLMAQLKLAQPQLRSQPQPRQHQVQQQPQQRQPQQQQRRGSEKAQTLLRKKAQTLLRKGEKEIPCMIKGGANAKPLDDTYNSDEEDDEDNDVDPEGANAESDDDSSSNPFINSSDDDLSIGEDDESSDDDSDKRDARCQQRRLSAYQ